MNSSSGQCARKYIYDLSWSDKKKLCSILDYNDAWEELGGAHLGYDVGSLERFRKAYVRSASVGPSEDMLQNWGTQNHTVLELFIHLSKMHHYQAMDVIKHYVPNKFHRLLSQGEENLDALLNNVDSKQQTPDKVKHIDFGQHNFECEPSVSNIYEDKKINVPNDNNKPTRKISDDVKEASENQLRQISYAELEEATQGWNGKNILGKGGFGTVYKGTWKCTEVAIKRLEIQPDLDRTKYQSQLVTELKSLLKYRHDNVLPLYAYSFGGLHDCLVYQYMRNGSLEDKLLGRHDCRPLTWPERHSIAIGVSLGLHFLHTSEDKPLVHGDIKSANILLDPSLVPKIGDFGLAREGPLENYTYIKVSKVHGTRPYLPSEFIRERKFSTKVDVYSFGIVMFELASGLRAYDDKRKYKFLNDHIESVPGDHISQFTDVRIPPDNTLTFSTLIILGKKCTSSKPKNRPEMEYVHNELKSLQCAESTNDLNVVEEMLPDIRISSATHSIQAAPTDPVTSALSQTQSQASFTSSSSSCSENSVSRLSNSNVSSVPSQSCNAHDVSAQNVQSVYSPPLSNDVSAEIPALSLLLNK